MLSLYPENSSPTFSSGEWIAPAQSEGYILLSVLDFLIHTPFVFSAPKVDRQPMSWLGVKAAPMVIPGSGIQTGDTRREKSFDST